MCAVQSNYLFVQDRHLGISASRSEIPPSHTAKGQNLPLLQGSVSELRCPGRVRYEPKLSLAGTSQTNQEAEREKGVCWCLVSGNGNSKMLGKKTSGYGIKRPRAVDGKHRPKLRGWAVRATEKASSLVSNRRRCSAQPGCVTSVKCAQIGHSYLRPRFIRRVVRPSLNAGVRVF